MNITFVGVIAVFQPYIYSSFIQLFNKHIAVFICKSMLLLGSEKTNFLEILLTIEEIRQWSHRGVASLKAEYSFLNLFINSFHPFKDYLLNTYFMPVAVLGPGVIMIIKIGTPGMYIPLALGKIITNIFIWNWYYSFKLYIMKARNPVCWELYV